MKNDAGLELAGSFFLKIALRDSAWAVWSGQEGAVKSKEGDPLIVSLKKQILDDEL